jgi:hypothetical protein
MSNTHESVSLAAAIALRAQVLLLQASFAELNALANRASKQMDIIAQALMTAQADVLSINAPATIQLESLNKELLYLDGVIKLLGGA